jgi:hypothetical protein
MCVGAYASAAVFFTNLSVLSLLRRQCWFPSGALLLVLLHGYCDVSPAVSQQVGSITKWRMVGPQGVQ